MIDQPVDCPRCCSPLCTEVPIEWGLCSAGHELPRYKIGDRIVWGSADGGRSVRAWAMLDHHTANVGSPGDEHVVVACRYAPHHCPQCAAHPLVVARFRDDVLVDVFAMLGDDGRADYWTLDDDDDLAVFERWVAHVQSEAGATYDVVDVTGIVTVGWRDSAADRVAAG